MQKSIKECGQWKIEDMTFPVPEGFPRTHDRSSGAPKPPKHRVPTAEIKTMSSVSLKPSWLSEAAEFCHHNLKKKENGSRAHWKKSEGTEFMRTCAMIGGYQKKLHASINNNENVPLPDVWLDKGSLESCHWAPMHLLFLGHTKSNHMMLKDWLKKTTC